jgi:hypothetical protein
VLEQNVIARVELHELGARNPARDDAPFRDRYDFVAARVQDERWRAHRAERCGDVHDGTRFEQIRNDVARGRLQAEIVEPLHLFVGAAGDEPRGEHLPERRVVLSPRHPRQIDHGSERPLGRRRSASRRATGVRTIEDHPGDAFRMPDRVVDARRRTL